MIAHKCGVFAYSTPEHFGLLTSEIHWWWAVTRGSTLETRPNYSPTDCFETFAQPRLTTAVGAAGGALDDHRSALMLDRREGLTKTYNRIHDPQESAADIARLRDLHVALDCAVGDAYGWTDLDLGHGFHEARQGLRFTFEPVVRQEILDRLLELNLERHAAEEAAGLRNEKKAAARKPTVSSSATQTTMFGDD